MANDILRPLGMNLPTFTKNGLNSLGPAAFDQWQNALNTIDPLVELLVLGFDDRDSPHLFATSTRGEITNTLLGFDAIGTGGNVARTYLFGNSDYRHSLDIGLITYRLCEAKFEAEGAEGVGLDTHVMTFGPEGYLKHETLWPGQLKAARALWKKRRTTRIPEKTLGILRRQTPALSLTFEMAAGLYAIASREYERACKKLVSRRSAGRITDDQWNRFVEAQKDVREADSAVYPFLQAWQAEDTSLPFVKAFTQLALAQSRSAQILEEAAAVKR